MNIFSIKHILYVSIKCEYLKYIDSIIKIERNYNSGLQSTTTCLENQPMVQYKQLKMKVCNNHNCKKSDCYL